MAPPRYAQTKKVGGLEYVTEGLIKTKDDLKLLDTLPDPDDPALYREAEIYLRDFKGDSAALVTVRNGINNTYLSMGIEHFCISTILEPGLVKEILWRFSEWSLRVVKNI